VAAKTKKTKRTTESVDDAIMRLVGGDDMKLVHSLTHEEQAMFYEIVEQVRHRDDMGVSMSDLWRVDYVQPPPSIETFITDPYWLGATTAPSADNEGIFPCWRDVLMRDFDLDSCVHNVVVTGSLGIGKSWILSAIFLYRITLARLLRDPQNFFGLSKGSQIYYVLLSLTRAVVADTIFADIQNFMANSEFFRSECGFNPDKKYAAHQSGEQHHAVGGIEGLAHHRA
jgi:hypothetical protein